jgi:alpha-glucosidase (family GH31 glycosyl hydrolase)
MQELIDDFQEQMDTTQWILDHSDNHGSISDERKFARLKSKVDTLRSIIDTMKDALIASLTPVLPETAPEAQKVQVTGYFYEGDEDKGDEAKWWKLMFGDELVELGFASPEDAEIWARDNGYIPMSQEPETYEVSVCRTGYGFHKIQVQARSPEEAEELALDEAGDHTYSDKSSEYTTDGAHKL